MGGKENTKLRRHSMNKKEIQKIKAWRYPCEDAEIFIFDRYTSNLQRYENLYKTKAVLKISNLCQGGKCHCGKNCKPQKIIITVEVA